MNTTEWLAKLISFDTTSRNSNLALIETIKTWCESYVLPVRLTYSAEKDKANLLAIVPAQDGSIDHGVLLSGHTDVVPVDGQQWETDPFTAVIKQDHIYGRGAADMKGFLAVLLTLIPAFKQLKLNHAIYLAFSYDEEVGCKGAPLLIEDLKQAGIHPAWCIVGEPTNMQGIVAHKGIQVFHCKVQGQAAHSSLTPMGCNAIEYAAKLIQHIRHYADKIKREGPFDTQFDVPYTTISTNIIHGGIAQNIIPASCEFDFEYRQLPQVNPADIIQHIKAYVEGELVPTMQQEQPVATIQIDQLGAVPSFESTQTPAILTLLTLLGSDKTMRKVAYATEAGLFQRAGIPTLLCGPGSIEQAHRPDEFVAISQLAACEAFLKRAVQEKG